MNDLKYPLHYAVIANKPALIERFLSEPRAMAKRDALGFTPGEIAVLLGRNDCLRAMGLEKILEHNFPEDREVEFAPCIQFRSYPALEQLIKLCPKRMSESSKNYPPRKLAKRYKRKLYQPSPLPLRIEWIDESLGYGVFASEDIPLDSFMGCYSGLAREVTPESMEINDYCFQYPTIFDSRRPFLVDANEVGNITRFINHSATPNLSRNWALDRGLLHIVLESNRKIVKGEQVAFNYGDGYWKKAAPVDL